MCTHFVTLMIIGYNLNVIGKLTSKMLIVLIVLKQGKALKPLHVLDVVIGRKIIKVF